MIFILNQIAINSQLLLTISTWDFLSCRYIQLNGQKLVMLDDGAFPELSPVALRAGRTVVMPPMSIGFYVIKNINAYACRR